MTDYWRTLSQQHPDADRVVAGLHEVELLETMTPYADTTELYFPRLNRALAGLPEEHWDAALSVFASVMYIPDRVLNATFEYLWWAVQRNARELGMNLSPMAEDVHIMEVDADGLVPDFARQNHLSARLNAEVHPRLREVQSLRQSLTAILSPASDQDEIAMANRQIEAAKLRLAGRKSAWILLTDKALSGQSLVGDLERVVQTRDIIAGAVGQAPMIFVCAQIATAKAHQAVEDWLAASQESGVVMLSALRLDERARVLSPECELFSSTMHEKVLALCRWFDTERVSRDRSLDDFRANGGGSLAFGYRDTGLTLVDFRNTPTNSLPLLWFNSTDPDADYDGPEYVAPFPRVHSRRGAEDPRWSEGSLWRKVLTPEGRTTLIERLADGR